MYYFYFWFHEKRKCALELYLRGIGIYLIKKVRDVTRNYNLCNGCLEIETSTCTWGSYVVIGQPLSPYTFIEL
ncbi:unnamed protein product [Lactuca virosa]|uniref:Uncharacterized protein n=1 Tax=Lactuca virosa TaxID=75947 RepID=A0AAU9NU33_9ASTR|nr:unnamed protein product [Lactuca virosa]